MNKNSYLLSFLILLGIVVYSWNSNLNDAPAVNSPTNFRSFAIEERRHHPCGPADIRTLEIPIKETNTQNESFNKLFKVRPVVINTYNRIIPQKPILASSAGNHLTSITCILRI